MSIQLGTKTPSKTQLVLLERAQKSSEIHERAQFLHMCTSDEDLTSGREQLHPDWLAVYREVKGKIAGFPYEDELSQALDSVLEADESLAKINPSASKVAFLLGAGASKPNPSGIPTVAELLPDLLDRGRRLDREDVNRLADFCESSRITNIEDLLTAAQLAEYCGRNPSVLRLIEFLLYREDPHHERMRMGMSRRSRVDIGSVAFLQDTLQVLFGLLSSRMLPAKPNPIHEAIANFTKSQPGAPIVTTNYDCCIDLALGVDGKDFDYRMQFANTSVSRNDSLPGLIKLHGSLNWFYCDTCQKVTLIDISKAISEFEADSSPYPVIGVCKDCGGQRRGLLVPPLAMKFDIAPALNPLLELAHDQLSSADVLVVVGFSFAEADQYISRMVSKWMQARKRNRLVIFDPDPDVASKMRRQCEVRIPDFDRMRVSWSGRDSSEDVPKFLSGSFYKPAKRKTKKKAAAKKTSRKKSTARKRSRRA